MVQHLFTIFFPFINRYAMPLVVKYAGSLRKSSLQFYPQNTTIRVGSPWQVQAWPKLQRAARIVQFPRADSISTPVHCPEAQP